MLDRVRLAFMRAERAKAKSRRDGMIIARGKRSAALGREPDMNTSLFSRCPSGAPELGGLLLLGTKRGDPKTHQGSDKPLCRKATGVGLMDKVRLRLTFYCLHHAEIRPPRSAPDPNFPEEPFFGSSGKLGSRTGFVVGSHV